MDSQEMTERAEAFALSIREGFTTQSEVEASVRGWITPGFLTELQAEQLLDMVCAAN